MIAGAVYGNAREWGIVRRMQGNSARAMMCVDRDSHRRTGK